MVCALLPLKVTVPFLGLKVALLLQVPVSEIPKLLTEASKVPAVMVMFPVTAFVPPKVTVLPDLLIVTVPVKVEGHSLPVVGLALVPKLV